jgi:uncharacterized protein YbbK (DUF523 family)
MGAKETLRIALQFKVSQSCGCRQIMMVHFRGPLDSYGVTAELLKRNGIKIMMKRRSVAYPCVWELRV